jgi:hypothetical protein
VAETSGNEHCEGPMRGARYEWAIHEIIDQAAAKWGDRYTKTGTNPGLLSRCKKGDGVLEVLEQSWPGRCPRVVVEMTTDSTSRRDWFDYLDDAQRNRDAQAALGIVRGSEVPGGGLVRSYGADKIVIAHDPERDDSRLLDLALYFLRCHAIHAVSRWQSANAREDWEQVIDLVTLTERKLESIRSRFTEVQRCAARGLADVDALRSGVSRLIAELLNDLEEPDF